MQGLSITPSRLSQLLLLLLVCCISVAHATTTTEHETQRVIEASQRLNINQADQQQLMALPGIGPSRAAAMMELREALGGFSDVNQLLEIRGIGPATLRNLEPLISF